jgi:serine protease
MAAMLAFGGSAAQAASMDSQSQMYADRANFSAIGADSLATRYIVTYAAGTPERNSAAEMRLDLDRVASITGLEVQRVRRLATGAELIEVGGDALRLSNPDVLARRVLVAFAQNPSVEYVEPDRMMHALLTPNDTYFGNQWSLTNPVGGMNQVGAWDISTGSGVRVAVIDTGITTHSDLSGQTVGGYDFISDSSAARDGNGRDSNPADQGDWYGNNECGIGYPASGSSWHGTHVTGTIVALTNNAKGIAGVAYGAKVVPVRVLGKCGGSVSDIVDAMEWASGGSVSGVPTNANPAKVISMSLGGGGACGSFQTAVTHARSRGTVVIVAAGNENQNVSNSSPANCSGVIAVAATTPSGSRASYSNYGSGITVSAPGGDGSGGSGDILSTLNSGSTTPSSETYAYYAGTSMATPHVSGLAAAMLAIDPGLTPDEIRDYITDNAKPLPGSCSGGCGAGIIDALATLQDVSGGGGGSNVAPDANFSFTTSGLGASFTDTSSDSDGSIVSRSWNFGDGGTSSATNPSHTYASAGTYNVSLTVTDDDGAPDTISKSVSVSGGGGGGSELDNGVPVTGLAATTGNSLSFTMDVPAGATNLKFAMSGGSGDADLYVRFGSPPGTASGTWDCRPYVGGNTENCSFANPQAGTWYVTIRAYSSFSGVSLTGSYDEPSGGGDDELDNGVPVTGLSATTGNSLTFTMDVPAGASNLVFAMSGGSGDGDLYVRRGSAPGTAAGTWDCRPYLNGNNETCTFASPQSGTWYVTIRAYSSFSGVSLTGSYNSGGGGGNVLQDGVPVTGLSATTGNAVNYTMVVPAGRTTLSFQIAGGSGDADLYVNFGSPPGTASGTYDCRPYKNGNSETCTFSSPSAGTWYVMVRAYSSYSGVSLTGNYGP